MAKRIAPKVKNIAGAANGRPFCSGKFIGNARGFGFITPQDDGVDIFVPPHHTGGALNGDTVAYKIVKDSDSPSGQVMEITHRPPMVGTFFSSGATGYVRPTESKIPHTFAVNRKAIARLGLADGHVVVFQADIRNPESCHITEILGHMHDPGVDVLALVRQAGISVDFSAEVMAEVATLPNHVTEAEIEGRLDLRHLLTFTIDGDDTKDIDDAISFEMLPCGNVKLGVHIADVTHYVKEGDSLDTSALQRGTSVYLADRVIPMLPHRLSSGICSLFADVDRLALSCIMTVNPQGIVEEYEIAESVIHSKMRWTYDGVQEVLDTLSDSTWHTLFTQMDTLRHILRKKREAKGALDFNLPEAKIRVDENGHPISIEPYPRTNATGIIEEFMILCNETIAAHFLALESPFVYRTHEAPSADKAAKLGVLAKNFGIKPPKTVASPVALQRLLAAAEKTAAAQVIATAVLHSLPQAKYTPNNPTHYGLASDAYCHFTSPIRRYADLQVHRIIKHLRNCGCSCMKSVAQSAHLQHKCTEDGTSPTKQAGDVFISLLPAVCAQCSATERTAETLEREVAQLKKVQFMAGQEGKTFAVTVSGVTQWGVYVTLPNTIEGIIPAENLQRNKYSYDKEKAVYALRTNKKSKSMKKNSKAKMSANKLKTLAHGMALTVRLISANEDDRRLVFHVNV